MYHYCTKVVLEMLLAYKPIKKDTVWILCPTKADMERELKMMMARYERD